MTKQLFIVKIAVPEDHFYLKEPGNFIYAFCSGLSDLQKTLQSLTPPFGKIPKPPTLSRWIKQRRGELTLLHPLLRTTMFEVRRTSAVPADQQQHEQTNRKGFSHKINLVPADSWPNLN